MKSKNLMETSLLEYLFSVRMVLFCTVLSVYVKRNIHVTSAKELIPSVDEVCPQYRVITNDVSGYINLLVRIAHIICDHLLF